MMDNILIPNVDLKISKEYDLNMKRFINCHSLLSVIPVVKDQIYQHVGLTDKLCNEGNIRIIDHNDDDNLILIHYLKYSEKVSHVRGVIFDITNTDKVEIVCHSFASNEDTDIDDPDLSDKINFNYIVCSLGIEGTIIRLFKGRITGKWYISTHKKIDGHDSRWGGPKFGDIFYSIWNKLNSTSSESTSSASESSESTSSESTSSASESSESTSESSESRKEDNDTDKYPLDFDSYFDPNKCYIFMINHPDNRLVCYIDEPKLYLLGHGEYRQFKPVNTVDINLKEELNSKNKKEEKEETDSKNEKEEKDGNDEIRMMGIMYGSKTSLLRECPVINYPLYLKIESVNDLKKALSLVNWKTHTGILVNTRDSKNRMKIMKFSPETYKNKREIRGNDPNFKFTYMRMKSEGPERLNELFELFPEKMEYFKSVENEIQNLHPYLSDLYQNRFTNRDFSTLPKEEYFIVTNAYNKMCDDASSNPDHNLKIKEVLKTSSVRQINAMIKRMKYTGKYNTKYIE